MKLLVNPRRLALAAALSAASLTVACLSANAQTVVFDNGNPDFSSGFRSDADEAAGVSQFVGDTFTTTNSITFNTVRWYGYYFSGNTPTLPDAFAISFHDTTAGVPDTAARPNETFAVGNSAVRTDTGSDLFGFDMYRYEATLSSPVTVGVGTFGISVYNNTVADTNDDWAWAFSAQTGNVYRRFFSINADFGPRDSRKMAFQLVNSSSVVVVPESGTFALLLPALGVLGAVVVRRRSLRAS